MVSSCALQLFRLEHHVDEDEYGVLVEWYWQRRTGVLEEKPATVSLCRPERLSVVVWDRPPASLVKIRRPTAWFMSRPCKHSLLAASSLHKNIVPTSEQAYCFVRWSSKCVASYANGKCMYTRVNKNPSAWNFLSPKPEMTCGTIAIIIRVVLLSPYLHIRAVSLSSIHYNQSHRVYINRRRKYICLI